MDFSIEDLANSLTLRNRLLLHHLMIGKQMNIDLIFDLFLLSLDMASFGMLFFALVFCSGLYSTTQL